jgi:hypothetical protein
MDKYAFPQENEMMKVNTFCRGKRVPSGGNKPPATDPRRPCRYPRGLLSLARSFGNLDNLNVQPPYWLDPAANARRHMRDQAQTLKSCIRC